MLVAVAVAVPFDEARASAAFEGLLGGSAAMAQLRTLAARVASADSAVLIHGETGTGKERLARAIHRASKRYGGPFVAVSCGGLSEASLDDALFGGAGVDFDSDSTRARGGLFIAADGGTLFLDEVGDMPPLLQTKIVRVLETGDLRALGINRRVDVRCVASTHEHLRSLVSRGKFRADLFFRLNVLAIRVPALREHPEDIAVLAQHFIARSSPSHDRSFAQVFTPGALELLEAYEWPGNVRELENLIECLAVTTVTPTVDVDVIHPMLLTEDTHPDPVPSLVASHLSLEALEERYIAGVLHHTKGNKAMAADILGIDLSTLYRREKKRTP